MIFRTYNGYF